MPSFAHYQSDLLFGIDISCFLSHILKRKRKALHIDHKLMNIRMTRQNCGSSSTCIYLQANLTQYSSNVDIQYSLVSRICNFASLEANFNPILNVHKDVATKSVHKL